MGDWLARGGCGCGCLGGLLGVAGVGVALAVAAGAFNYSVEVPMLMGGLITTAIGLVAVLAGAALFAVGRRFG